MRGYHLNREDEQQIKAALYADAYSYNPPTDLKQRIDARLARQKKEVITMRKMSMKKVAIVAAAACVLTGTVCMAGGKIAGYVGGTRLNTQTTEFSDIAKLEKKLDLDVNAPESFDNGYAFANASVADFDALDESGNKVGSIEELDIYYTKGDRRLNYSIEKGAEEYTEQELARMQVIEQDGVTYHYAKDQYLFLPPDAQPTEEELAAQEAGTLAISYGSDEREEKNYVYLRWSTGGQKYMLAGFDLDLDAQDMVAMAMQLK